MVDGMPCAFGRTASEMRAGFFDIVSVLGSHFHFTFNDYLNMTAAEMLELYSRMKKQIKAQNKAQSRRR